MRNTVFCVKRGVLWGWFVNIFLSLKTGKRNLYYLFKNEY
jgi:hypothetical protein